MGMLEPGHGMNLDVPGLPVGLRSLLRADCRNPTAQCVNQISFLSCNMLCFDGSASLRYLA